MRKGTFISFIVLERLLDDQSFFQSPRNGTQNDKAHPFIHPTAYAVNLDPEERKVYELIVRKFLATCSQNAIGLSTKVTAQVGDELFDVNGLIVKARNYLEIYPYDKWGDKLLPEFTVNEIMISHKLDVKEGNTSPPSLLTEADLIAIMDQNGIGTDATIHEHIKKIIERNYVFLIEKSRQLYPSQLGIGLVEAYDKIGLEKSLSKPLLRKETEVFMKEIADGSREKATALIQVIQEYKAIFIKAQEMYHYILDTMKNYLESKVDFVQSNQPFFISAPTSVLPYKNCDKCQNGKLLVRCTKEQKWYIGCNKYPNCKNSIWFNENTISNIAVSEDTCRICSRSDELSVRLLSITIKDSRIIALAGMETIVVCITCSNMVQNVLLSNSFPRPTQKTSNPTNQQGSTRPPLQNTNVSPPNQVSPLQNNSDRSNTTNNYRPTYQPSNATSAQRDARPTNITPLQNNNFKSPNQVSPLQNSFNRPINYRSATLTSPNRTSTSNFASPTYSSSTQNNDNLGVLATSEPTTPSILQSTNEYVNSTFDIDVFRDMLNDVGPNQNLIYRSPQCQCNRQSATRTVIKDGPNKDKIFHGCEARKCNFFQWKDDQSCPITSGVAGSANGVVCFKCNAPGHFATNCQNNQTSQPKRNNPSSTAHKKPVKRTKKK